MESSPVVRCAMIHEGKARRWGCSGVLMFLCLVLAASSVGVLAEEANASEMPTRIERLRGLAEVWGMVHLFHPALADPDAQAGWWVATREAIHEVEAAETIEAYAKALQALVAKLGDQVTAIYLPDELKDAAVPVSLSYEGGKTVIEDVLADAVVSDRSIVGWELVSVDGVDVAEYLAEWLPIASGETPELRRAWVYEKLLAAEVGSVVCLGLVDDDGSPVEVAMAVPSPFSALQEENGASMSALGPGLAHVRIPSLNSLMDFAVGQFRGSDLALIQVAAQMMGGVVLDLRSGAGFFGHPQLASKILPIVLAEFATDESMGASGFIGREHRGYAMDTPQLIYSTGWRIQQGARFGSPYASSVPLVVLVDEESYTVSAPFLQPLQASGRAIVMGDVGTVPWADAYQHILPGGVELRLRLSIPEDSCGEGGLRLVELDLEEYGSPGDEDPLLLAATDILKRWSDRTALPRTDGPQLGHDLAQSKVPFPVGFSRDESLLGLFKLWTVAKYFYPYRDLVTDDWPELLEAGIADVEAATSVTEYALCLQQFLVHLQDGHAFIHGFPWIESYQTSAVVRLIEGRAVTVNPIPVVPVTDESGYLPQGQIIGEVNGIPVAELIPERMETATGSTETSRSRMAYSGLLHGYPEGIELLLLDRSGAERLVYLCQDCAKQETGWTSPQPSSDPFWMMDAVAYVDICSISDEVYEEIKGDLWEAEGVLVDLRGYPSPTAWYGVSEALFAEPVAYQQGRVPVLATPDPRVQESLVCWTEARAGSTEAYQGRVVVLIDGSAQSRAETVGLNLRQRPDLVMVGEPTAGTDGNITTIMLPYGLSTWLTGTEICHADGSQLQGIGIIPDVTVHPTVQDIREGRDEILEKGLEVLRDLIEQAAGE